MKSVRIVQLDPATLRALAAGELPLASPVPLTDHLTGPEHRPLWRRRSRQVAADPAAAGVGHRCRLGARRSASPSAGPASTDRRTRPAWSRSATRSTPRTGARGYARAALAALLDRAAREPAVHTVRASVRPDNLASRALVESFGFVPVGQQWDDEDGLETVYERPA